MELIDRALQRQILLALGAAYPAWVVPKTFCHEHGFNRSACGVNLEYLLGHGLIERREAAKVAIHHMTVPTGPSEIRISHAGIDFLADDGGLSAILGVITVRLHEDTIKALLLERIEQSSESESVKESLKKEVRALPAEAMKNIAGELVRAGISSVPDIAHWLQSFAHHVL
ncbi:MAG TPA: hypothetical protein VK660_07915 [Xanthomonadaceae bacterium]|jgi:hypothetical protein|nr:hypothetical protein [Xanthomonadaceae bacterium]